MAGPLPMIEGTFETRIMATIETLQKSVNDTQAQIGNLTARIDQADARSREAMVKVEQERAARSSELERMQQRIEQIGTKTSERFDELAKKLNEIGDIVSRLSGKMDGWDELLQMREEATRANTAKIERLERDHAAQENALALLTSNQASLLVRVQGIDKTIFGDREHPDGPASVFASLKTISDTLSALVEAQKAAQKEQADLGRELASRTERLELAQKERAERWSKRRARLLAYIEKIVSSRAFWLGLTSVTGIYALTPQDIKDGIGEFFRILLGG